MRRSRKVLAVTPLAVALVFMPISANAEATTNPASPNLTNNATIVPSGDDDLPVSMTQYRDLPIARANPKASAGLIKALPQAVKSSSAIIDKSIDRNTILFLPDGRPVPGQSADKSQRAESMALMGGCGEWTNFWAPPFNMGPVYEQSCGVWGHVGYVRGYTWEENPGVYTSAVVQARGFECVDYVTVPKPGSDCGYRGYREVFRGIGSGASGAGFVFWGNIIAKPAVRAQSLSAPAGYSGVFR